MSLTVPKQRDRPARQILFGAAQRLLERHRFLRFLLVGALNTGFGYGLFLFALAVLPTAFAALCLSTAIAVAFNFVTNSAFVYRCHDPRRLFGFVLVYGGVFLFNAVGLELLARVSVGPRLASILLLPGGIALSYLLNARYTFGRA